MMSIKSFNQHVGVFVKYSSSTLIFMAILDYLMALELVELHVPLNINVGVRAKLSCLWVLEPSDVLYSVKWYKDGNEFFRHVPRDAQPYRKFPLRGVDVEDYNSSGSNLTLAPAHLETAGRYRCEVSGERPRFHTVSEYADMHVIAVPTQGPIISGFKSQYNIGDYVKVNCTAGQSTPATQLAWYINGEPAPSTDLLPAVNTRANGLETTQRGLMFKIDEQNLVGELKLKCLATLPSVYWRSVEETATVYNYTIKDISNDNIIVVHSAKISCALKSPRSRPSWFFRICFCVMFLYIHF